MVENIVSGDGGKKRKRPRWPFTVAIIVALVGAAGFGVFVRWMQTKNDKPTQTNNLPKAPASVQDAQFLLQQGKHDEATASIEKSLQNKSLSKDERYELYMEQGRIAYDSGKDQAVYDAYKSAYGIKQTFDVTRKLGAASVQLGKKDEALAYYKKAKEINPKDSPTHESDDNVLNQVISALENGEW